MYQDKNDPTYVISDSNNESEVQSQMVKSKKSVNDRSCKDSKRFENEMQLVKSAIN